MPRKPKVELPADLTIKDSPGIPAKSVRPTTPEESTNPFISAIQESWNENKDKQVIVPADAEDTARAQIRSAAAICGYGARTGVEYGTNQNGDRVVAIHFRATEKRKRNPNGSGRARDNAPADSGDAPAVQDKVAANAAYGKDASEAPAETPTEAPVPAGAASGKGKNKAK